ncbi:MAG: NAD(P)-dependent oxidoreductase [Lachnospiraceae bacterium]|nr:NAD(P)-dependent oxidoreductase [Lachnospiraceae bacterium]
MKVVVTGSTSFLGAALVKRLLEEGCTVFAVIRPGSAHRGRLPEGENGLRIIERDLQELNRIEEVLGEYCDAFVHLGWGGSGSKCRTQEELQKQNVDAAVKAWEGAKKLGCKRFLFSGSQAEYGLCREKMREAQECRPLSAYGQAKAEVYQKLSKLCQEWQKEKTTEMEYIHVRIFSVYGPGDHPWTLVASCLDAFSHGGHIDLSPCTQLWNFLYLDDLTEGIVKLLFYPGRLNQDGLYNLAGPETATRPLKEYVECMHRICGGKGSFAFGKREPNAEGLINLIPDISRMETELNWHPEVSFEEGITRIMSGRAGNEEK